MIAGDKEDNLNKKILNVSALFIVLLLIFAACDGGSGGSDSSGGTTNPPPTGSPDDFETRMLGLVNDARAEGRDCGNTFFPAAPPLKWDDRVGAAAQGHSDDMAEHRFLDHEGSDGSDTGDRLMNEGYDPSAWGETILVGIENETNVVKNFLDSPEHCSILMDPAYEDFGAGAAEGMYKGQSTLYWTFDLATENN